jgi:hypothetical protein
MLGISGSQLCFGNTKTTGPLMLSHSGGDFFHAIAFKKSGGIDHEAEE